MASILSLPNELITQILGSLVQYGHSDDEEQSSRSIYADLVPVSTVNRRMHELCLPLIYKNLYIQEVGFNTAESGKIPNSIRQLSKTLSSNPQIRSIISSLSLTVGIHHNAMGAAELLIFPDLNLRCFRLSGGILTPGEDGAAVYGVLLRRLHDIQNTVLELELDLKIPSSVTKSMAILPRLANFNHLKKLCVNGELFFGAPGRVQLFPLDTAQSLRLGKGLEELEIMDDVFFIRYGWTMRVNERVKRACEKLSLLLLDPIRSPNLRKLIFTFTSMGPDVLEYDGEDRDADEPRNALADLDARCKRRGVEAWVKMCRIKNFQQVDVHCVKMDEIKFKSRRAASTSLVLVG